MAWPISTAARAQLASGHFTVAVKVDVYQAGTYLQTLPVTSGSVVENETSSPRRTLTATVVGDPTLVPADPGDLLHPLTGNELYPYRGIVLPDGGVTPQGESIPAGGTEWVPLGVFRMSKPQVVYTSGGVTITLTGNDRSNEIAIRQWTGPYTAAAGLTVDQAIQT